MMEMAASSKLLDSEWPYKHYEHVRDGVLAFERAGLLFVFNFSPSNSWTDRKIGVPAGCYRVVLSTDSPRFGGFNRVDSSVNYATDDRSELSLYLPARTALVFARNGVQ